jgi:surface carbohydrate biosynthesis protein (TIGR04326 family)
VSKPWLIWDLEQAPMAAEAPVIFWSKASARPGQFSIPALLEERAIAVRRRYLSLISALGRMEVDGIPLQRHLQDAAGNNFWWMGLLAEKSPFKTPDLYQTLKLLTLEELLRSQRPSALSLHSEDCRLAEAISALCKDLGIHIKVVHKSSLRARISRLKGMYEAGQWMIYLCAHIIRRWPLRSLGKAQWRGGRGAIFLCSYFAHLDSEAALDSRFHSRQWGGLPEMLVQEGHHLNWLQNYWPSEAAPQARSGAMLAQAFNLSRSGAGTHKFVDSFLNTKVIWKAIRSGFWLRSRARSLRNLPAEMQRSGLPAWLWPILEPAWKNSIIGRVAAANCLSVHLFDAALRDLPRQQGALYLFENQAWEKAMLTAWRRHGHGPIIGVIHATVPFWHLYYAEDPVNVSGSLDVRMPLPDAFAVNGEAARAALQSQGYQGAQLVSVEALRYLSTSESGHSPRVKDNGSNGRRILIVGDMEPSGLSELLRSAQNAAVLLGNDWQFSFKPHPAFAIKPDAFIGWQIPTVSGSLQELLADFDFVVSGNSTSASLDAFLAGKPVMIFHSWRQLNLSPLRGHAGVEFFESPEQLAACLQGKDEIIRTGGARDTFFFRNAALHRWKKLIDSLVSNEVTAHSVRSDSIG